MPPFRLRAIFGRSERGASEEGAPGLVYQVSITLKQSTLQCHLSFQCWP